MRTGELESGLARLAARPDRESPRRARLHRTLARPTVTMWTARTTRQPSCGQVSGATIQARSSAALRETTAENLQPAAGQARGNW